MIGALVHLWPSPARAWWQEKGVAERRAIAVGVTLVTLGLFAALVWIPMQRDIDRLALENIRESAALDEARRRIDDMMALQRTPAAAPVPASSQLEQSLAASGLRSSVTDLKWQNTRASVTFASVEVGRLVRWLERLHRDAGIVVHEATLTARVEPGLVRAELLLGR